MTFDTIKEMHDYCIKNCKEFLIDYDTKRIKGILANRQMMKRLKDR